MAEGGSKKKKLRKPVKPSKTVVSPKARKKAVARKGRRKAAESGRRASTAVTRTAPAKRVKARATSAKTVTAAPRSRGGAGGARVRASTAAGPAPAKETKKKAKTGGERKERVTLLQRVRRISPRTVILVMLMIFFIAFAFGPTTRNLNATSKLKQKEAELADEEEVTKSLEQQVSEARSMEYIEQEARRQRMVAGGETLYIVTSDETSPTVEYRVKALQSMDEAWERVRLMLNCQHSREGGDDREGD